MRRLIVKPTRRVIQWARVLLMVLSLGVFVLVSPLPGEAAVTVSDFSVSWQGGQARLEWTTASETQNLGFNLYRSMSKNTGFDKINGDMIPTSCLGCIEGADYSFDDAQVSTDQTYYYKLESIDFNQSTQQFGPVPLDAQVPTAEPTAMETATTPPTDPPTAEPTDAATAEPTDAPTAEPTGVATAEPTAKPTGVATAEPTDTATDAATAEPTDSATDAATAGPTKVKKTRTPSPSETLASETDTRTATRVPSQTGTRTPSITRTWTPTLEGTLTATTSPVATTVSQANSSSRLPARTARPPSRSGASTPTPDDIQGAGSVTGSTSQPQATAKRTQIAARVTSNPRVTAARTSSNQRAPVTRNTLGAVRAFRLVVLVGELAALGMLFLSFTSALVAALLFTRRYYR